MTTDIVFGRALVGFVMLMVTIALVQGCALLSPNLAGPPTTAGLPSPAFTATPVRGAVPTPATPALSLEEEARDAITRGMGILAKISPIWYLRARAPGEDGEDWRGYEEGWGLVEQGIAHFAAALGESFGLDELIEGLAQMGLVEYSASFSRPSALAMRSYEIQESADLIGLSIFPPRLAGSSPSLGGDHLILRGGKRPVVFSWFRQPGFGLADIRARAWREGSEERVVLTAGISSGHGDAHSMNLYIISISFVGNEARLLWRSPAGGNHVRAAFKETQSIAPSIVVIYTRWVQEPFFEANAGPHVRYVQEWEYDSGKYQKMRDSLVESPYGSLWFFMNYLRAGNLEEARGYSLGETALAEAKALGLDQSARMTTDVADQLAAFGAAKAVTGRIALASDPRSTPIAFVDMLKVGDKWLVGGFRAKED